MKIQFKSHYLGEVVSLIADLKENVMISTPAGSWVMIITNDTNLRSVDINSADLIVAGHGVQLPKYLSSKVLFANTIGYIKEEEGNFFLIIE